jgi:hypothetical protein
MVLLLGVSRADGKGTARLQVSWLTDRRVHPSLPIRLRGTSLRFGETVAAGVTGSGMALPVYSGGTAWDSHPLRLAAGLSQFGSSIAGRDRLTGSLHSPCGTMT